MKDEYGVTIRNARDKLAFTLDPAKASQVARRPIQYETGFTLLPGSYVIKVLARDSTTGRIGTFLQSFVVPNLEREHSRLRISSVVLGAQRVARADALFSVKEKVASDVGNPLMHGGRKLLPSVARIFRRDQTLSVFLQSYPTGADGLRPLVAYVAFYRDGVKAFESQPFGVTVFDRASRAVSIDLTISLADLEPGAYDCQVTVLDPDARRAAFWRTRVAIAQSR